MRPIDHIVFNARDRMDEVAARFTALGFTVTPRGHHTLGSINHTIVFGAEYLELLGYPPGQPPARRPELEAGAPGWMATVLRTDDADATRAALLAAGLAPRPVQSFSRPVDGGAGLIGEAAFRVTRLEPDALPGTWMYFCQHLTPDLVWRPAWQAHPNGVRGVAVLEIAVPDPAAAADAYACCLDAPMALEPDARVAALDACRLRLVRGTGGIVRMGFAVDDLRAVRGCLETARIGFDVHDDVLTVDPDFMPGAKLQFTIQAR